MDYIKFVFKEREKNIIELLNFDTPGVRSSTKIRDSSPAVEWGCWFLQAFSWFTL